MTMNNVNNINPNSSRSSAFSSFEVHEDGVLNEKLYFTQIICEELTNLLLANNGKLGEPFLIYLSGTEGVGKTMLIDLVKTELKKSKISIADDREYGGNLISSDRDYLSCDVVLIDNLFGVDCLFGGPITRKDLKSDKLDTDLNLCYFEQFLHNIYNYNKVVIITSKFSPNEIIPLIKTKHNSERLNDRLDYLLSKVPTLELVRKTKYTVKKGGIERTAIKKINDRCSKIFA